MKWPTRKQRLLELESGLVEFSGTQRALPGTATNEARRVLATQMIASLRRLDYSEIIRTRDVSPRRCDPTTELFDPERVAVFHARSGNLDEAVWLVFLATHFGEHPKSGWRRVRDVYSGLGASTWTWDRVSKDVESFKKWLESKRDSIGGAFGSHRKYETLDPYSPVGTGAVVDSYVSWIGPKRSHGACFAGLILAGGNDPGKIFDEFYQNMSVARFGRLGKFDFLAMLGRLGLAPISPASTYLAGATGPLRGARLLFGGDVKAPLRARDLELWLIDLDAVLHIGMQPMEDSLCNWQKSPSKFIHFTG